MSQGIKPSCPWLVILLLGFTACQTNPTGDAAFPTTPMETPVPFTLPTAIPTTVLEPARDFETGECPAPRNQYLFIRYAVYSSCSPACDCPQVEIPAPAIDREGEEIIYGHDQMGGRFDPLDPNSPAIGLVSYGPYEALLYAIEAFPYEIPRSVISIISCDQDGNVVVIRGNAYSLEAGQSWSHQSVGDGGGECYYTDTITLTHNGWIPRTHFHSDMSNWDEFVQLEVSKRYFSLEEGIAARVSVYGEDGVDVSGFCNMRIEGYVEGNWEPVGECSQVPDYVPEPYVPPPGVIIPFNLPTSTLGAEVPYQYELAPGTYRLRFTYWHPGGVSELVSPMFYVVD